MTIKKSFAVLATAGIFFSLVTCVWAQDDLDNLLSDLEGGDKKAAKPEEAKPAEAAPAVAETASAAEEKKAEEPAPAVAEEKPAEAAPAVAETAPAAEEKKAEEPAPAVAEEKPAEAAPAVAESAPAAEEKKAEELAPAVAEEKPAAQKGATDQQIENFLDDLATIPGEKKNTASSVEQPVAVQTEAAPAAEEKKAKEPVAAEEKPAEAAPAVAAAPAPADPNAALISDIASAERLRRQAYDAQAVRELEIARNAMQDADYERAIQYYRLAFDHLNDREDMRAYKRECATGIAEANYQAARRERKLGNRDAALEFAKTARRLRHPKAQALVDALEELTDEKLERDVAAIKHRRNDADYKEDRELIRKRLRLSAQYFAVSDLESALEQCDLVLRYDPYNGEAIQLRDRIQRRRQIVLEKEREATRKGMIADVDAAWRPVYAVDSKELKGIDGGTMKTPVSGDPERSAEQAITARMKEMILPSITFKPPATIIDAVDFFRQASKDYDRPEIPVEQRGFNFVLTGLNLRGGASSGEAAKTDDNSFSASADDAAGDAAPTDVPQIPNISASNLSLWEALKTVCDVAGFKFKVQGSIVMVMPKDMSTEEFVTRSYNVTDNFAERMSGASSDMKEMGGGANFNNNSDEKEENSQETDWKGFFSMMGVNWPKGSQITYIKTIGKLRVTNTADQLAVLEQALNELNVTPMLIEIETRFVEVAQEDLNSLGFEWLLNTDYTLNVGGKLGKVLGLKNAGWTTSESGYSQDSGVQTIAEKLTEGYTTAYGVDEKTGQQVATGTQTRYGPNYDTTTTRDETWTWKEGTKSWQRYSGYKKVGPNGERLGNFGVGAVNGTDYTTGMRYLNNSDSRIAKKDGTFYNDQFMKVNAFLGNADLSMILHMLSQRSDTDLLSAPKVVTKSGQEAIIKVVTEYIYPQDYDVTIESTSSGSSSSGSSSSSSSGGGEGKILPMVEPQNFTMREVGVILDVTPEVSAEGQMINLDLKPQIVSEPTWKDYGMRVPMAAVMSSSAFANQTYVGADGFSISTGTRDMEWFNVPMEQPFFKVRSIETHVSLYNGATVVMGGLITEDRKSMEDKIPFLGDIPWLGRFFRSRSEWSDKRNLLIFVTARLVDPRGRQMTMGTGEMDAAATPAKDAAVTPAPEK